MTEESKNMDDTLPSPEEMKQLLWAHADGTAERIIELLGGPLSSNLLTRFMEDPACLRYTTEIRFTEEGLDAHQFAEPFFYTEGGDRRCMLHIHRRYALCPEALPYFVAYMAAPIMYGDVADSDLCEHLGAMLLGEEKSAFYEQLCDFADWRT